MKKKIKIDYSFLAYLILLICILFLQLQLNKINEKLTIIMNINPIKEGKSITYDSFAECLTEKGFVMYGSQYCGYCAKQRELFGDSFKLVNYVECTENEDLCMEKGIQGVPTWFYPEGEISGLQTLKKLSELSGCDIVER